MATRVSQRLRALALYKELHRLGRDYEPSYDFHGKLRKLYESKSFFQTLSLRAVLPATLAHSVDRIATENRNLKDDTEIERALALGEYIKNGVSFRALQGSP
ncbi:hypothetical protein J3R82DRAFT_11690 [Butyriboletus roseoflavus]|nr:hypothetical protein J3R82DRAFT_11690 [Butyriboletus roseoflavus]